MTAEGRELPRDVKGKLRVLTPQKSITPIREGVALETPEQPPGIVPPPTETFDVVDPETWNDIVQQQRLGEVIESEVRATLGFGVAHQYRSSDPDIQLSPERQQEAQQRLDAKESYVTAVTALSEYTAPRIDDVISLYADSVGEVRAQEIGKSALLSAAKTWRHSEHSFTEYARAVVVHALREDTEQKVSETKKIEERGVIVATVTRKDGVYTVARPDGSTVNVDEKELALLNIPTIEGNGERSINFTKRDVEIMTLRGKGLGLKEVGETMGIAESTVKNLQTVLFQKTSYNLLGMKSSANGFQVYTCMYKLGLIEKDQSIQEPFLITKTPRLNSLIHAGNLKITLR